MSNAPTMDRRGNRQSSALPYKAQEPITYREVARTPLGRDWLLKLVDRWVNPLSLVLPLFVAAPLMRVEITAHYLLLAIAVMFLSFRNHLHLTKTNAGIARHVVAGWLAISGLLYFFGWTTGLLDRFDRTLLGLWWCAAPVTQIVVLIILRHFRPVIARLQGPRERAIVVGMNEQGMELARRMSERPTNLHMVGFFDDRPNEQLRSQFSFPLLGKLQELPQFVNENQIDVIYISLPMVRQPRIQALLDGLRDTTASIYFVPDLFVTDLIQGQVDFVHGLPVVAVCETPFTGLDGVLKHASDFIFALTSLLILSPLLLCIALGIKLTSPGPVIFRQRRYGLDGRAIIVYKFRSMTVTEDGDTIQQASIDDPRVTPFGAFLRKTSLDELPQLVNVLQGRMSVVGPRPHAVAHNEIYRKLITGYMLRHKVRPGITGWAQVNGLRGETETVEKMRERVSYDLDYVRNWSLRFDTYIIAKTVWVVLKGDNAY